MTVGDFFAAFIVSISCVVGLRMWWASHSDCAECKRQMRESGRDRELIRLACAKCRQREMVKIV